MALAIVALALVPLIYSLDRGVWIGIAVLRALPGRPLRGPGQTRPAQHDLRGLALVGVVIVVTPLHSLISGRLSSEQNSNSIRSTLNALAVRDAIASPLIGYGDERHQQGSPSSIAVGPTANCITCGQAGVGSTGQLWLLLVSSGFLGTILYLSFFGYGIWRYRRDRTPYGLAGVLVLLLSFVYMFTYEAVVAPLAFTMLAYALLWRNDIQLRSPDPEPEPEQAALTAGTGPRGSRSRSRTATSRALT